MRRFFFILALSLSPAALTQALQCFYQTADNSTAYSYFGNDLTHDNVEQPRTTDVISPFARFGRNGFILDGPVFTVGTTCTTSQLTFDMGVSSDQYHQHCICQSGSGAGQGCTVISATTGLGTAGTCPDGGHAKMFDNTYDVGLYCISGGCTFGRLYAHIGPIDYVSLSTGTNTFPWTRGPVVLPSGAYAIGMGTNCDDGSVAGQTGFVNTQSVGTTYEVTWSSGDAFNVGWSSGTIIHIGNPTYAYTISSVLDATHLLLTSYIATMSSAPYVEGASYGAGNLNCATALGEGGVYGKGSYNNGLTWSYATQLVAFKVFTTNADSFPGRFHADCLLYDPSHNNTIGLPGENSSFAPKLSAYDAGGCTYINGSAINPLFPIGEAPHMINFAIW